MMPRTTFITTMPMKKVTRPTMNLRIAAIALLLSTRMREAVRAVFYSLAAVACASTDARACLCLTSAARLDSDVAKRGAQDDIRPIAIGGDQRLARPRGQATEANGPYLAVLARRIEHELTRRRQHELDFAMTVLHINVVFRRLRGDERHRAIAGFHVNALIKILHRDFAVRGFNHHFAVRVFDA